MLASMGIACVFNGNDGLSIWWNLSMLRGALRGGHGILQFFRFRPDYPERGLIRSPALIIFRPVTTVQEPYPAVISEHLIIDGGIPLVHSRKCWYIYRHEKTGKIDN
jgi:hypothetical protein